MAHSDDKSIDAEIMTERLRDAQNPGTPSSRLEELVSDTLNALDDEDNTPQPQTSAILEAVAAHPNTPPYWLGQLMAEFAGAFCRNPIAPFVLLEMPDFLSQMSHSGHMALLREPNAPAALVRLLSQNNVSVYAATREAARFHVAAAGEVESKTCAEAELRAYWRAYCARADGKERQWHIDLAELGLAPQWAKGVEPFPEPDVPGYREHALVAGWFRYKIAPNSHKERALLRRIGPAIEDVETLAKGLGKNATVADLVAVLDVPGNERGLVHAALLFHPAANEAVVARVAAKNVTRFHRLIFEHPNLPMRLLKGFLHHSDPAYRRLARRHKKAPADSMDRSRKAFANRTTQGSGANETPFVSFIGSLCFGDQRWRSALIERMDSTIWTQRLEAALYLPAENTSELSALALDGNRFVRWAAQTRLQNPNYVFTWEDGA